MQFEPCNKHVVSSAEFLIAAHYGNQLPGSILPDPPACKALDRYSTLENGSADFLG